MTSELQELGRLADELGAAAGDVAPAVVAAAAGLAERLQAGQSVATVVDARPGDGRTA